MINRRRLSIRNILICLAVLLTVVFVSPVFAEEAAEGTEIVSRFSGNFWALVPAVVAIVLALITKEVYMSLITGILCGALFVTNFSPVQTMHTIFDNGMVSVLTDKWNVGILIFTVSLGIIGALVSKSGGSAAYGKWAEKNIKTRVGALISTVILGMLIFVDDYFNCLTVGNVMRPVSDKHKISRAKLSYIVDATAAPICIIAPISSWAAAVTGVIPEMDNMGRFTVFIQSIPYNLYALLTITMLFAMILMKFDFGPMARHEENAMNGDLYTTPDRPYANANEESFNPKGRIIDMIIPIFVFLIPCCILGLAYTGGFFTPGVSFANAMADCNASMGLVYGCFVGLILTFIYYMARRVLTLKEFADCFPMGFRAMVPAIFILIFAWTLSSMTKALGAAAYVAELVNGSAAAFQGFLPAIIFAIGCGLSFATGTSWGTFGILLPIVAAVFPLGNPLLFPAIGACLAGAVCGDHCSPISDTTIMASAGAQSNHINHVSTQLPYAMLVAGVSFVFYIVMGFWQSPLVSLIAIAVLLCILFAIRSRVNARNARRVELGLSNS